MATRKRSLQKVLRYHLPLADTDPAAAMQSVADHWRGFSWQSGPVIVRWVADSLPELQVWTATEAEGRRVIAHALAHIGAESSSGEWYVSVTGSSQYGKIATVTPTLVSARGSNRGITPHLPIL